MKRFGIQLAWALSFLLIAALQVSLVSSVSWMHFSFDLILVAAFCLIGSGRERAGVTLALAAAYVVDLYMTTPFGMYFAAVTLAVISMMIFQRYVLKQFAVHAFFLNTLIAASTFHIIFGGLLSLTATVSAVTVTQISNGEVFSIFLQRTLLTTILTTGLLVAYRFARGRLIRTTQSYGS